MFLKLALIFIIWGIYGDLEKKKNDETSSFCMVLLTFLIIFS